MTYSQAEAHSPSTLGNEGEETDRRAIAPHLSATPMVFEATLAAEALRLCAGASDPTAQDILELSRLRFLRWLKHFLGSLDDVGDALGVLAYAPP